MINFCLSIKFSLVLCLNNEINQSNFKATQNDILLDFFKKTTEFPLSD